MYFCLLYRALHIYLCFWEKVWEIWASVVFSDGWVYWAIHPSVRRGRAFALLGWHAPGLQEGR